MKHRVSCFRYVSFRTGNDPCGQVNIPSLHTIHLPHYRLIYSCSIGNFFFAGARVFFQSLDAAIFLFSRVSQIPAESLVLPVISTNDRLTLGCELWVMSLTKFFSCCTNCLCTFMCCFLLVALWLNFASPVIYFVSFSFYCCSYFLATLSAIRQAAMFL